VQVGCRCDIIEKSSYSLSSDLLNLNHPRTICSDLDVHIPRQKQPTTALPSDIRAQLGLKKRSVLGRQSDTANDGTAKNKPLYKIEKRTFLRKGSGQMVSVERKSVAVRRQTIG